ncbi:sulfite exporter TauE/SafE family protein [Nocardioides sp. GY 10127]|uniref:sulfite exporter TauE/SafE family protein n=1 Tax=Nocardioides sp. GY 10127 TaxID=2569762 RepID=UPI0010A80697|nr:sulfite exporter TauE/SafE family protein [Nocardioides sp. GY 10127]TIC78690.1 sulfite exporter TauE/SafE family protein [Nocardioides sp. GY 10127]TIC81038.1 sulfite exporter TauE/SafE family protein [Nocardioides sp. GY 10127]
MELLLLAGLGLAIGLVLGGLGGGGGVLTVPALVLVVGQSAVQATASSLVVVGVAAVVGALGHARAGRVRWGTALGLGVAGLPTAWVGAQLSHAVPEPVLLLAFSGLMVVAAAAMVRGCPSCIEIDPEKAPTPRLPALPSLRRRYRDARPAPTSPAVRPTVAAAGTPVAGGQAAGRAGVLVAARTAVSGEIADRAPAGTGRGLAAAGAVGLAVGLLTGFLGVGGGFVVVPALVIVLRLPMSVAVGTSLVVVALNSASSLLARLGSLEIDWAVVVPFSLAAVAGVLLGRRVADRLPAARLRHGFAALLVLVAAATAVSTVV